MVGWLILLFLLVFGVLFPLTIGLYFKGKAKADKMTTTTNTSTTCVETSTTPTPSPTLSPTSTPIVFDWEVDE